MGSDFFFYGVVCLNSLTGGEPQLLTQLGIIDQPLDRICQGMRVFRWDQQSRNPILDDIA